MSTAIAAAVGFMSGSLMTYLLARRELKIMHQLVMMASQDPYEK